MFNENYAFVIGSALDSHRCINSLYEYVMMINKTRSKEKRKHESNDP